MTSSIKPEVHKISLRRQKRTEPRVAVLFLTCVKFAEDRTCSYEDMIADRQTDRQTDRHAHRNTRLPYRGEGVITNRPAAQRSSELAIDQSM